MTVDVRWAGGDHGDAMLMERVTVGDEAALAGLYDRYGRRAYRLARSICRDAERAEDAVQEAFVSVWRCPTGFDPDRGVVGAWLLTVVRNRAVDASRRERTHADRQASLDGLAELGAEHDVAHDAVARVEAAELRGLLEELPDGQREVIALAFFGELTHREIAEHLALAPGTVKGRMRLGLQKLRVAMDEIAA